MYCTVAWQCADEQLFSPNTDVACRTTRQMYFDLCCLYPFSAQPSRQCSAPTCHFSTLKGTVPRDFRLLVFFMNQFPPSPWVYHKGCFEFFLKFAEIFASQGAPPVLLTPLANGKIFNQKKNLNYFVWTPLGSRINIYINFCLQFHLKVCAVWYCFHYLPQVSVAKLSPVLLIPVAIRHRCRWHRRQIRNGPNGILGGWGETDSWKNKKQESRDTVPLTRGLQRDVVYLGWLIAP